MSHDGSQTRFGPTTLRVVNHGAVSYVYCIIGNVVGPCNKQLPYRPLLLRKLNRELFIRWLLIEHQKWYELMMSSYTPDLLFGVPNGNEDVQEQEANEARTFSERNDIQFVLLFC